MSAYKNLVSSGNSFAWEKRFSVTRKKKIESPQTNNLLQIEVSDLWDDENYLRELFWRELPILKSKIPLVWAELIVKMAQ